MNTEPIYLQLLSRLERAEARLLAWGVVDGFFTWSELEEHAQTLLHDLGQTSPTSEDLISRLRVEQLIVRPPDAPRNFRTRMAETIRLAALLRQVFSNAPDAWRTAPKLVADFRFALTNRQYPARNLDPETVLKSVEESTKIEPTTRRAIGTLLQRGDGFRFAGFQQRATIAAFQSLGSNQANGVVVAAGTGSGKTLAFYLPALGWVASVVDQYHWTKVMALYPRIELLRDQFRSAYQECRRLDGTGRRKISIGAFFGSTPRDAQSVPNTSNWHQTRGGWVCPFFTCPSCDEGQLVWMDSDRKVNRERLTCSSFSCGLVIHEDEVVLTRLRMQQSPADILFTTTESLNRRMSDDWSRSIFGLGQPSQRRPRFLLMDEIHVNTGTSGAQTALLVRRWRAELGSPVVIFGLSATLSDAGNFFSDLVSLPRSSVVEVSPYPQELVAEGMEYSVALRGDPTSGTALLSTTIQAALLLERMLDGPNAISAGTYGRRLYAFADQLDSVNRLYWSLRDAEGWNGHRPTRRIPRSLASLRSPSRATSSAQAQAQAGQRWSAATDIGWQLSDTSQLRVGRTSSQDAGVTPDADIVVATASLEVGFDDPLAGAVIQHKAPRNAAQYIQRRGRAGRSRGMRPWTMLVLSDYGRDRMAYQTYELLFDPEVSGEVLPTENRYVLKQQAGFVVLEWLGSQLRDPHNKGHIWRDATGPARNSAGKARQQRLLSLVRRLMVDSTLQSQLAAKLSQQLRVSDDEVRAAMWESPRAIMTELLPTLQRRLASGWSTLAGPSEVSESPLPEFLPATLFNDLLVPEVEIHVPAPGAGQPQSIEPMGIVQMLTEFCPGHASRRFAIAHQGQRHWFPIPAQGGTGTLPVPLSPTAKGQLLGRFRYLDANNRLITVPCLRPSSITLEALPANVRDTSTARPHWQSQILPTDKALRGSIPDPSRWTTIVSNMEFYLHVRDSPVRVRRFFDRASSETKYANGASQATELLLVDTSEREQPMALGFELDVDAVAITLNKSSILRGFDSIVPAAVRAHRSERFRDSLRDDQSLPASVNRFQREWLAWLAECSLLDAVESTSGRRAIDSLTLELDNLRRSMQEVLNIAVGTATVGSNDEDIFDPDEQGRLHAALQALLDDDSVLRQVLAHVRFLWVDPLRPEEREWAFDRYKATLASAVVEAMSRLNRQLDTDALVPDLSSGSTEHGTSRSDQIWITEQGPGGTGILERFYRDYSADPRRFWDLVYGVLQPRDYECIDEELSDIVALDAVDPIRQSLQDVRLALDKGNLPLVAAQQEMRRRLSEEGHRTTHAVISAINSRLLVPGSNTDTDRLLRETMSHWRELEEHVGFDIDVRTMAFLASRRTTLPGIPTEATSGGNAQEQQARFGRMQSLLWIRGGVARSLSLKATNRYVTLPSTDRLLVTGLEPAQPPIDISDIAWREETTKTLNLHGEVRLICDAENANSLSSAIFEMMEMGIEVGYLIAFPRLSSLTRRNRKWLATLNLRESMQ